MLSRGAVSTLLTHDHVGHAQVDLARVVAHLIASSQRIDQGDGQIGFVEREVVVPTLPKDDVRFTLGTRKDSVVVDAGVHRYAGDYVRFVLFKLFDGALAPGQVLEGRVALHLVLDQIAVGHGVLHHGDLLAGRVEDLGHAARRLVLADASAHAADGDDRLACLQRGVLRPEQNEGGAQRVHECAAVHDIVVGDIRVREDDLVDVVLADQRRQVVLGGDRNAVRVESAGEERRVAALIDVRHLRRREGDDIVLLVVAEVRVEVVEVAPRGPHDYHPGATGTRHVVPSRRTPAVLLTVAGLSDTCVFST